MTEQGDNDMERFAIRGHICYSEDQKKIRTMDQGYVVCEDGKSRGVFETLPEEWRGIPCRDYGDKLIIPGLDSDRFDRLNWIKNGAGSPYEFKIGNAVAGAFRLDNYSIKGLRLSVSGYIGNSFSNTLSGNKDSQRYKDVKGTVAIGAFDFHYSDHNWVVRGNFDYGHLSDADIISTVNKNMSQNSPSPQQDVASSAIAAGVEAGYNLFSQFSKLDNKGQKFYVFGRYDYYDSMYDSKVPLYQYCGRQRVAAGINYYPIDEIVVKGEYSIGLLKSFYNNEPAISIGIAYAGFFTK